MTPESHRLASVMDCLDGQCRSPVACGAFGYCREMNFTEHHLKRDTPDATDKARRE